MKTIICLLMGLNCPIPSQAQAPIWQTVFTDRTTAGVSSNIKNSGQTQHILYGTASSNTPSTCGIVERNVIRLEASYDNSTFTAISTNGVPDTVNPATSGSFYIMGNGSYPFIRARIVAINSGCKINLYYSGSFPTVPAQDTIMSKMTQSSVNRGTTVSNVGPVVVIDGTGLSGKFVLNFWDVYANEVANVNLTEYTDSSCTVTVSGVNQAFNMALLAGGGKTYPWLAEGYYRAKQTGSSLCLTISGASGTALTTWWLKFRFEE